MAARIDNARIFATGPSNTSGLDSLTFDGNGDLWAEYGDGADSTGAGGSSTIVEYAPNGSAQQTLTISGSVDGLKYDPVTGQIWALQNQDGNSTLSLINPATGSVSAPLPYAATSETRGYDDVAFLNGQVYLSYTNPTSPSSPVLQQLVNGNQPIGTLAVTNLLTAGATGTNIATGQTQTLPMSDPDSLKALPDGDLVLTSGADNAFTIIHDVGTAAQSERFDQLQNLPAGSSLDDVIVPSSTSGTFYVSNAGTDQVEAYKMSGLNPSDAYADVGTEIVQVDLQTGAQTVVIAGLSQGHGLVFTPSPTPDVPKVTSTSIAAVGSEAGGATQPDSITMGDNSVFVEYGNGADSTGKLPNGGSSTIVQYSTTGAIEQTYSLPGEIDGLKFDPTTGQLWALENQDANSHLFLIDPKTQQVSAPLSYGSGYVYGADSSRGFDDVAFQGSKVFLSYTNPTSTGDAVVEQLVNGNSPTGTLQLQPILRLGDTGTNLVTGQANQLLPVADPDSLKTLPNGSLILTSDHDASLTFIKDPGTVQQTESFVTLPAGSSGLDDAIVPTATSGTFLVSNAGANDVLKVNVTNLNVNDVYISVGSDNSVDQLDPTTGQLTPVITGLNSPHGLAFIPSNGAPQSGTVPSGGSVMADALKQATQSLGQDFGIPTNSTPGTAIGSIASSLGAFGSSPLGTQFDSLAPAILTSHAQG